jgi:hypothetical protein
MKRHALAAAGATALLAGLAAAGPALAGPAFKWRDPQGRIGYSAVVPHHAVVLKRIERAAPPRAAVLAARARLKRERRIADAAAATIERRWARVQRELYAARQELARAQARQEAGRAPLSGERLGTAGGASRLGPSYANRQAALGAEVERARERLRDAFRARDALNG